MVSVILYHVAVIFLTFVMNNDKLSGSGSAADTGGGYHRPNGSCLGPGRGEARVSGQSGFRARGPIPSPDRPPLHDRQGDRAVPPRAPPAGPPHECPR